MIAKTITTIPTALPDKKGTKIEDCAWFEKEKIYNTTKHNKRFFAKKIIMAHYVLKLFLKSAENYLIMVDNMMHMNYV